MRIVVVGGTGFLGGRAVDALRRSGACDVRIASRRASGPGTFRLDLQDPSTFSAIDGADVVADVANSSIAPPFGFAEHCLTHGITLLEASSDRPVVEGLHSRFAGATGSKGSIVLGAGIFTGLSNLLGRAAVNALPGNPCTSLEIGVRSSPFSGAGGGTVDLMADALGVETVSYENGSRSLSPAIRSGPPLTFPSGTFRTIHASFAEPSMLHWSLGVPTVHMYMAPKPSILRAAFLVLPSALLGTRFFRAFMRGYFRFLRRVLLRSRAATVELIATARNDAHAATVSLTAPDGMTVGGVAIAAMALALADRTPQITHPGRAVVCIDEVCTLDDVISRMNTLAPPGAEPLQLPTPQTTTLRAA